MRKKRFLLPAVFTMVFILLTAIPSFAMVGNLAERMSWSYMTKLDGQLFCLNKVTLISRDDTETETIWTFKDEYFYKLILEGNCQEYRGQSIIQLRDDCSLISTEDTLYLNGQKHTHTLIAQTEDGYVFSEKTKEKQHTNQIKTDKPLYLYDHSRPWLTELLLKKQFLSPEKACQAISPSGRVIQIEYQNNPGRTQGESEEDRYLADKDLIYVCSEQMVYRIDAEDYGICEFMVGEDFSEEIITGYTADRIICDLPSNTPLLQPQLLTNMTISIKLRPIFNNLAYLKTPTARQRFSGSIDEQWIEGLVTLNQVVKGTTKNEPFVFPVVIQWGPEFTEYLSDHPLLQIDHIEIITTAKEITKGATNTWEAAVAIARWVGENVTYDESFSGKDLNAVEILKEKKGVCGHFAVLTVALCRALKIPTRYITGYAYIRTNNSFSPHAWVEVFAGKNGWKAIDPTWGQYESADLTHIGFSDSIALRHKFTFTGLKPGRIEILHFTPEETGPIAPSPLNISQLLARGDEWRFEILSQGMKIGDYTATLNATTDGNYRLREKLTISHIYTEYQSEMLLDEQGYVLYYYNNGQWERVKTEREFLFAKNLHIKVVSAGRETQFTFYRLFNDEIAVDILNFLPWGWLAARLVEDLETETTKTVTVFLADSGEYKNLAVTIRPYSMEEGIDGNGWLCNIAGAQSSMKLYLNKERLLTRIDMPEANISAVLVESYSHQ
ncbi:MAG: transglutaminase domain-containing protein [Firmicutes bacterium]|jgi:transglutaminase-like putative cysteine protease|nr:transglutaminase domain-containing protein [Bacillota bacterium]